MDTLRYVCLKIAATLLRTLFSLLGPGVTSLNYDEQLQIPSRDAARTIKAHVYKHRLASKDTQQRRPVLINFHGSGFILPMLGSDDEFCRLMADEVPGLVVLDVLYRLGPEHPFPAAPQDAEDVVAWVLQQGHFDSSRVAVCGFSAGGNIALALAGATFSKPTIAAVLAFYPLTDLALDPAAKKTPDPAGQPIPSPLLRFFSACYLPPWVDRRDPRVSPSYGAVDGFPPNMLIITAAHDNLAPEAEALADAVAAKARSHVVKKRMAGCGHGWDKQASTGDLKAAKDEAYALASQMLSTM